MDQSLADYINRYVNLTEEEFNLFYSYLKKRKIEKKAYLLTEGKICNARYFITQGCFRFYYLDKKDNEQIIHFGIENWWITDYDSLINRIPTQIYIQAIENSEVLELNQTVLEEIYPKIPKIERLFRIIMEKTFVAAQRRIAFMFSLTGEELYHHFVKANPHFAQRVPQYMLASYLGFTPEFLSKIKAGKN